MSKKETGGPAFPVQGLRGPDVSDGMTLRDWFAGQALKGMLASSEYTGTCEEFAGWAYQHADAMLAERSADIRVVLSALSTAEQERDALAARCAELEAIPERLRNLDMSLCQEPHGEWSLLDCEKEIAVFGDSIETVIKMAEAAIVGKKEG